MLNDKGQCCGRKPIPYKRDRHLFCDRCDRAYDMDTKEQIANWAWLHIGAPGCFSEAQCIAMSNRTPQLL